jgi:hypothetical protein
MPLQLSRVPYEPTATTSRMAVENLGEPLQQLLVSQVSKSGQVGSRLAREVELMVVVVEELENVIGKAGFVLVVLSEYTATMVFSSGSVRSTPSASG